MWVGVEFYKYQATEIKYRGDILQTSETSFPSSQVHHRMMTEGRHALLKNRYSAAREREKIKINL